MIIITMDPLESRMDEGGHMVDVVEPFFLHMYYIIL
jgi:hypothetical protein